MVFGNAPQEPTTWSGWLWSGARRSWTWVTDQFTSNPVAEQLRDLDGRAQVHGTAIEIISAQVSDLTRDQREILNMLGRLVAHAETASKVNDETSQIAADVRRQLSDSRSVPQDLAGTRAELSEGLRNVQHMLAEEAAGVRARLAALPSTEQVQALIGEGTMVQDLASMRAQLNNELQKVQQVFAVHSVGIQGQLANLPSSEQMRSLFDGGTVARELASARTQFADGLQKVHDVLAEQVAGIHERLAVLPSADQVHALIENGTVAQDMSSTKVQLADGLQKVHDVMAAHSAGVHERMATLPSSEQIHAKVQEVVAEHTAGVHDRIATLPSTEQVHALLSGGAMAQDLASTRAQLADGMQKIQHVLAEHTASVTERLANLPSTEQVHALVEGGTANNIQSTRKLVAEEALRGQTAADRMATKLASLQSRSVIPLTAQGLVMCRNPLGFLAVPADDLATIGALADGVLPKQGTLRIVEKYLKAGGTFVDVGANVGLFSLLAARIVGPTGKVIAIEPAPLAANALRATVNANGLANVVRIEEIAAGAERGLGTLAVEPNCGRSTLLASETSTGTVVVSIAPLDEILAGTIPDIVKIDVEGWEPKVIAGMEATLRANPNIILIMDLEPARIRSTGLSASAWVDWVIGAGLQMFEIDERNGELTPLLKNGLEEIVSTNVLLARSDPSRRDAAEGWLWRDSGTQVLLAARAQD